MSARRLEVNLRYNDYLSTLSQLQSNTFRVWSITFESVVILSASSVLPPLPIIINMTSPLRLVSLQYAELRGIKFQIHHIPESTKATYQEQRKSSFKFSKHCPPIPGCSDWKTHGYTPTDLPGCKSQSPGFVQSTTISQVSRRISQAQPPTPPAPPFE